MKISDLMISPKSLGDKLWLVDVSPAYEYQNNKRTDTILGYRYSVALPEKGLDKVDVRIDGQQQMEAPDGYVEVRFDGLEVFIYWSKGDYHVGAKATGIHLVNSTAYRIGRRWGAGGEQIFFLKKNIPRRQRQRRPLAIRVSITLMATM